MRTFKHRKSQFAKNPGFTLIELLVVISIMGVLAAFTIPVLKSLKAAQYKKVARAELDRIATALENYKIKYGVYPPSNALAASPTYEPFMFSQLYYELSGTTNNGSYFVTLDGSSSIAIADVPKAYGVSGFVNCSGKGGVEDTVMAQNFIPGMSSRQIGSISNTVLTANLITSVGGPDPGYQPLGANTSGINPIRYRYPGVNNPNSYDLWVQLVISGKTNLICNWSKQPIINSPLP